MEEKKETKVLAISEIKLGDRQRKEYNNIESMADSLKRRGQLSPLVLKEDNTLVAGGRRLRAAMMLGWSSIWVVYKSGLSEADAYAIELEENIKREDLLWWEQVMAIERYHRMREGQDPDWTSSQTAEELGISTSEISRALMVARGLEAEPELKDQQGVTAAYNYIQRKLERQLSLETARLLGTLDEEEVEEGQEESVGGPPSLDTLLRSPTPSTPDIAFRRSPSRFRVLQGDFIEFARTTSGKIRYNFLHCDFPYGVGMDTSALQGTSEGHERYEDTESKFWLMCNTLIGAQDLLCQSQCHMMFWFSMKFYTPTKELFENAGWTVNPHPLVWLKSDGKGILPDPQRGPRQICETAFLMSRGDRKIVRAVANGVAIPSGRSESMHLSEKPVEVLDHFFRMFVDETTEMLDPSCGAGSAIVAALNAGASRAFGIELSEGIAALAKSRVSEALVEPEPLRLEDLDIKGVLEGISP